jgi:hypothetical protein
MPSILGGMHARLGVATRFNTFDVTCDAEAGTVSRDEATLRGLDLERFSGVRSLPGR